jgi:hypothetical protein
VDGSGNEARPEEGADCELAAFISKITSRIYDTVGIAKGPDVGIRAIP